MKIKEKSTEPTSSAVAPEANLSLSFDVGHSSIGWAVLKTDRPLPEILGCGVVVFRADDCLASKRRQYRRQRRHIRATRTRIKNLKLLLSQAAGLTKEELDRPGSAWPWLLAARVLRTDRLRTDRLLSWNELWDVLRWYAHNRGYDGNRAWSQTESDTEADADADAAREQHARALMEKHGTLSMAETVCAVMGVDPTGEKRASATSFKRENAAFPRRTVEDEVRKILDAHVGVLKGMEPSLIQAIMDDWRAVRCEGIRLPKRYKKGVLFGQLLPRFNNRIIGKCPMTGEKVPAKACCEFFRYRWAMILASVRVMEKEAKAARPLNASERQAVHAQMLTLGKMTADQFKKVVRKASSAAKDNLDNLLMHPEAKKALWLDPARAAIHESPLGSLWEILPERLQKRTMGQLRRGKEIQLAPLRDAFLALGKNAEDFDKALLTSGRKSKKESNDLAELLKAKVRVNRQGAFPSGRAPYARKILSRAFEEVMKGGDPREKGGCLYASPELIEKQESDPIPARTNNHLVRHRLMLLERLVRDVIHAYAQGQSSRIRQATIEINRDVRDFSGMDAKDRAADLASRLKDHQKVAQKLSEAFAGQRINDQPVRITAGLIRKARIAEDLGWTCPYTGQKYEPVDLLTHRVDKDHIVPRSLRPSDALDALVLTFSEINTWKGQRTAMEFVTQEEGKPVPGLPNFSILSRCAYERLVQALDTRKGHRADQARKKRRQEMLRLEVYSEKGFLPRDLTMTSHLAKLGAQVLKKQLTTQQGVPVISALPGSLTARTRQSWDLLGCLGKACPRVFDESGVVKTKTEIREITHLHHALDACVLGLASHFIPHDGRVWEAILRGQFVPEMRASPAANLVFSSDVRGRSVLKDLPSPIKEQLRERLAELRVVQHVPSRMAGLKAELNTWRLVRVDDDRATLQQKMRQPEGNRIPKEVKERIGKLIGPSPKEGEGKLQRIKGALVISDNFGIALDPQPTIIPFHKVWPRIQELKKANGGRMPRILRQGNLIRVPRGRYMGLWRIFSVKASNRVDLGTPDTVALESRGTWQKREVSIQTLIDDGMVIERPTLSGGGMCPTTSSTSMRTSAP